MKIHIEKHDTRNVWTGTHSFESYYTDDEENIFPITFKETKVEGVAVSYSVVWDENNPFPEKEAPYTKKGSEQEHVRLKLELEITKHFIEMQVNVFFN